MPVFVTWVKIPGSASGELKKAIPNTRHQMLFRAQNILGYRHYADDVVEKFCERAHVNGVDVFRVFDAMNDPRNMETAIKGVKKVGGSCARDFILYGQPGSYPGHLAYACQAT